MAVGTRSEKRKATTKIAWPAGPDEVAMQKNLTDGLLRALFCRVLVCRQRSLALRHYRAKPFISWELSTH
jgi:hypothetical protein